MKLLYPLPEGNTSLRESLGCPRTTKILTLRLCFPAKFESYPCRLCLLRQQSAHDFHLGRKKEKENENEKENKRK